jgi:hypothetical protein
VYVQASAEHEMPPAFATVVLQLMSAVHVPQLVVVSRLVSHPFSVFPSQSP